MYHVPTVAIEELPDPLPDHVVVLDVREQVEWDHGHIEGAVHIPLKQLPERLAELSTARTVVVCTVGGRSARAVAYLAQQGHDVANLEGGMLDWVDAGRPMVSETGDPPHVV